MFCGELVTVLEIDQQVQIKMFTLKSSVCVLLYFVVVESQFSPPANSAVCTDGAVQAGNSYMPHEAYCEAFYHCDTALNRFQRSCAYGTVFNPNISTCVRPEVGVCNNWVCDASKVGWRYPSLCCDQYYTCTGSGFTKQSCSSGNIFNMVTGQCNVGKCVDQANCVRFGTTEDPAYKCYDVANRYGNPCLYDTVYNGINIPNRPCAYGTAFNATTCQCSILSSACPSGVNYLDNKNPEYSCRQSLSLEFNVLPLVASSEKLSIANLGYYLQTNGVYVSGGNGIFSTDPVSGLLPFVYIYHLNTNQLSTPVVMSVVFRWDKPTNGQTITLLTNDYYTKVCNPTLEVTVTYNAGVYTANLFAIGANEKTKEQLSARTSASISLAAGNFMEVLVLFDGTLSGQLIDRGTNGLSTVVTNKVTVPATSRLGDYIALNKCGVMLAKGLNGAVERFQVREGCLDFSKVKA